MKVIVRNENLSRAEQNDCIRRILQIHSDLAFDHIVLESFENKIKDKLAVINHILTKMGGSLIGEPHNWNSAKRAECCEIIPNNLN